MFSLCKAKINIKSVYLNAYKTIGDTYGTYNYILKFYENFDSLKNWYVSSTYPLYNDMYKFHLNPTSSF